MDRSRTTIYIVERVYFSDGDYGPPPEVTEQRAINSIKIIRQSQTN
ncbi:MAG: hypothetical protein F6K23_18045 [Okeania sp. SIO2C9]|nr:hypothetical protein [Okeania sp. SIO2C9]NEQ74778.1 hypothetical protein [Okeania sp. SIO2C9]